MVQKLKKILLLNLIILLAPLTVFAGTGVDYDDANCQAAWLMDTDVDPLTDSSQNTNTLALKAADNPDYATADNPAAYSTGYYTFDGSDEAHGAVDQSLMLAGDTTILCWLYLDSVAATEVIFSRGSYNYMLYGQNRTTYRMNWYQSLTGNDIDCYTTDVFSTDTWYHFAITYTHSTITAAYYLGGNAGSWDGGSTRSTGTGTPNVNDKAFIAGWHASYGTALNGRLDEIAVFDRILTSTEISDIYDNGLAPSGAAEQVADGSLFIMF